MESTQFKALTKTIGDRAVLQDIDLRIGAGECIILSGDNGAGKSTLLRIMAGLLSPDRARCRYNGSDDLSWCHARPWLLHNVAYLHQEPYIFDFSVVDNIAYGLRRRGVRSAKARETARQALRSAGLDYLLERNGKQLSGGEKQRVALLRGWVLSPRVLLLDEPIASMDESARHRTLFLIRRLLEDKVSLVITAHEPRLFAPLAARHLRLHKGTLHNAPPITQTEWETIAEPAKRTYPHKHDHYSN